MTINKTQGQSLSVAGVPASHMVNYTLPALEVEPPRRLYIFAPGGQTMNVVYQKALE
jgi:hypothetical protein